MPGLGQGFFDFVSFITFQMKVMKRNPAQRRENGLFPDLQVVIRKGSVQMILQIASPKTEWLPDNLNESEIHVKRKILLANSAK